MEAGERINPCQDPVLGYLGRGEQAKKAGKMRGRIKTDNIGTVCTIF